ncbi:hypothetical protein SAMN05192574_104417 [Mucilaginibacter gossypiicola]|uniref:Uncharacterized protein n=1 Tax=Mucilaginibacter gossypiicola TaxID=551995 RepID=A0A1H8K1T4_9SPHI|nr:hypothetical protein SAMN05192574_104417 [Mucilaginibacter gossypiicola]
MTNYQLITNKKQNSKPIYYRNHDKIIHINVKIKSVNKCYFNNKIKSYVRKQIRICRTGYKEKASGDAEALYN